MVGEASGREGGAVLDWEGANYPAPSPSLFLLPANTPHWVNQQTYPLSFWYIELAMDHPAEFVSGEQAETWNRLQESIDYASPELMGLKLTLDALGVSLERKAEQPVLYDEELIKLDAQKVIRWVQNRFRENGEDPHWFGSSTPEKIKQLTRYMEVNYYLPTDLEQLADKVHLEKSYLGRAFKQSAGVSPMQYLNRLRLNAAISFLVNTNMPVRQIAEATGFNSIHYFSRLFKQKSGCSPLEWRDKTGR
ncbi:MAG: AraC family transcriptional regulator [Paenibacillaceae bacterium]|nr:AraC family transcriptional regulator [Paenibacillaceae bacterium]